MTSFINVYNGTTYKDDEIELFWNPKFGIEFLHVDNLPKDFGTLRRIHEAYEKPMFVKHLVFASTGFPAEQFLDDYEHMTKVVQPQHVEWKNIGRNLLDLKMLKMSSFFQLESIETLKVYVEVVSSMLRRFNAQSLANIMASMGNPDNNRKSKKTSIKIDWSYIDSPEFARHLVSNFKQTQEPHLFFQEIICMYEHKDSRHGWMEFFAFSGTLHQIYRSDDRFISPFRMIRVISRKDGWKIALDAQTDGNTSFYVFSPAVCFHGHD